MQGTGLENDEEAGSSGCCWGRSVEELETGAAGGHFFSLSTLLVRALVLPIPNKQIFTFLRCTYFYKE